MRPFYDNPEAMRIQITRSAIAQQRTLLERWAHLDANESEGWNARAALTSGLLANCTTIVDLGCGLMTLERYLPATAHYKPVDVVRRDHRTTVVDFNKEAMPVIEGDAAVGLGLLEYLYDVPAFVSMVAARYRRAIFSYNISALRGDLDGLAHGWVNSYANDEIESLFSACGYAVIASYEIDHGQKLWDLQRQDPSPQQQMGREA